MAFTDLEKENIKRRSINSCEKNGQNLVIEKQRLKNYVLKQAFQKGHFTSFTTLKKNYSWML